MLRVFQNGPQHFRIYNYGFKYNLYKNSFFTSKKRKYSTFEGSTKDDLNRLLSNSNTNIDIFKFTYNKQLDEILRVLSNRQDIIENFKEIEFKSCFENENNESNFSKILSNTKNLTSIKIDSTQLNITNEDISSMLKWKNQLSRISLIETKKFNMRFLSNVLKNNSCLEYFVFHLNGHFKEDYYSQLLNGLQRTKSPLKGFSLVTEDSFSDKIKNDILNLMKNSSCTAFVLAYANLNVHMEDIVSFLYHFESLKFLDLHYVGDNEKNLAIISNFIEKTPTLQFLKISHKLCHRLKLKFPKLQFYNNANDVKQKSPLLIPPLSENE